MKYMSICISSKCNIFTINPLPTNLRKGVYTTCEIDNVDQEKRSNYSKEEFHGTLISATNHLWHDNLGEVREPIDITGVDMKKMPKLPDSYVVVQPAELNMNKDMLLQYPHWQCSL